MEAVGSEERQGSLGPIPAVLNLWLAAAHLLVNLYQFFALPLFLLPSGPWWAITLVPLAALNNPFWSLIHEAIHNLFHPCERVNVALGRLLSIFFGSPFRVLRLSHLLHHKLNRTPLEGTEFYDPERVSRIRASLGYYSYVLGGLYLLELLSPLLFFLPRRLLGRLQQRHFSGETLSGVWFRSLVNREAVGELRADGVLIFALLIASLACYGENWGLLLGALVTRAFLVSFLDNVYHYRTPVNDIFYACNLRLPPLPSKALLYFNLHGVHHRNPSIPWLHLPEAFAKGAAQYSADYFVATWRQLYGAAPLSSLPVKAAKAV